MHVKRSLLWMYVPALALYGVILVALWHASPLPAKLPVISLGKAEWMPRQEFVRLAVLAPLLCVVVGMVADRLLRSLETAGIIIARNAVITLVVAFFGAHVVATLAAAGSGGPASVALRLGLILGLAIPAIAVYGAMVGSRTRDAAFVGRRCETCGKSYALADYGGTRVAQSLAIGAYDRRLNYFTLRYCPACCEEGTRQSTAKAIADGLAEEMRKSQE